MTDASLPPRKRKAPSKQAKQSDSDTCPFCGTVVDYYEFCGTCGEMKCQACMPGGKGTACTSCEGAEEP